MPEQAFLIQDRPSGVADAVREFGELARGVTGSSQHAAFVALRTLRPLLCREAANALAKAWAEMRLGGQVERAAFQNLIDRTVAGLDK